MQKGIVLSLLPHIKEKKMAHKKWFLGILATALAAGVLLSSCATRIGDFTMMSSKNVDLNRINTFKRTGEMVKGSDMRLSAILIFPLNPKYDLKKALDKALEKIPGSQVIVDVRIDVQKIPLILITLEGYVVSGTVLVDPDVVDASETTPDKPYLVMDTTDGENFTKRYISEEEYLTLLASK